MSVINRIDEFFRLHKNKEVTVPSIKEAFLHRSHERSFSLETNQSTLQSLRDLLHEAYEMKRSKRFKEDSASDSRNQFKGKLKSLKGSRDCNCSGDNGIKLAMKENKERERLNLKSRRMELKKSGYWSSSNLFNSSDDEAEQTREGKDKKWGKQKYDQKPTQAKSLEEEEKEDKEAKIMKREHLETRNFNIGVQGPNQKDREKDDESLRFKIRGHQIEFSDIVMVTSEILKPGKQSSLEEGQMIAQSIVKKRSKYLSKTKGGSIYGKESYPNFAAEILKNFSLEQLRITADGNFDKRLKGVKDYLELCSLAKIDPMQYYKRNCLHEQRKTGEDFDRDQAKCAENPFLGELGRSWGVKRGRDARKDRAFEMNPKKESKGPSFGNIWIVPNPMFGQSKTETKGDFAKLSKSFREAIQKNADDEKQQQIPTGDKAKELSVIEESSVEIPKPRVYRCIIKTDGVSPGESLSQAREELRRFPMDKLRITGKGFFDRRTRVTREFVSLCEKAMEDPLKYYNENYVKKQEERWRDFKKDAEKAREKSPLEEPRTTKGAVFDQEDNKGESKKEDVEIDDSEKKALEKLKIFPMEKLRVTLGGWFDRRYNISHEFTSLCEKAKKDPMRYYEENWIAKKKLLQKDPKAVSLALVNLKKFPLDDLRITQKGFFDRRLNLTHEYLDLCERANKDPIDYYNENIDSEEKSSERKEEASRDKVEYYKENRYKEVEKKCCEKGVCDSCHAKEQGNPALEELKRFPLEELRITRKGWFDRRFRVTKQYMSLCEKAGKDPMSYYRENLK